MDMLLMKAVSGMIMLNSALLASPHLIRFLAIPSPTQQVGTWLVWDFHFIHNREMILTSTLIWPDESLCELIKPWFELSSRGARRRSSSMFCVVGACRDWICAPLRAIRCSV